ncbi:Uncharacterized conserved protein, contains NRDE domain [Oceanospirillum multiglobuliferum]|uniref:NRDE family protein n=1 Tax=Oceanospirillum multiglobuliferum TaxID=64969 RepID=A0A1T4SGF7_9GAMM|nr:NRDE family protein [Oceanospirillum multiglobuliferum]OPX54267.1 hypothetical protein BTE48_15135 [Oceanospirillum multiglobuliferum]SKA27243.1 Uncharacterized conserved protein, contains NRDE domain [Oceanospirillum multiglobuliferum]
MCLILFAWQVDLERPLILAANRDEFYQRPTATLAQWQDLPVIAGQDLQEGGTWLGITPSGRFAAVTNYRQASEMGQRYPISRGELCRRFLSSETPIEQFLSSLEIEAQNIGGFNLLLSDGKQMAYASNRFGAETGNPYYQSKMCLEPGVYGLSNHRLNSPWPKVTTGIAELQQQVSKVQNDLQLSQALFEILENQIQADDSLLPDTGIGLEKERFLAPRMIASSTEYGTRASTVLIKSQDGIQTLIEQSYAALSKKQIKNIFCTS